MNFLILFIFLAACYSIRLTDNQLKKIQFILKHPDLTPEVKKKVHNILIKSHNKWLHKKVHTFAGKNKFSSEFKKELYEAAKVGLLKSLKKYNGKTPLHVYADKYIFYEFTKSITNQMPLGYLNHYERYIKKVNITKPTFIGDSNIDKTHENKKITGPILCMTRYGDVVNVLEARDNITNLISKLPYEERELFYYKYHKGSLQVRNKAKDVYKLANISHETYRQKMKKIDNYLKTNLFHK